jgi:hypothetical protein
MGQSRIVAWALLTGLLCARPALASTPSGNEFALALEEAKTPDARTLALDEGLGKDHFFRYLHIVGLEEGTLAGSPYIDLRTYEPSSRWTVTFRVLKSLSLAKLKEAPVSKVGDAVAVTGRVKRVVPESKTIVLSPVIVRYKDRLTPKVGKELYHEVDDSGIVYSFTGGKEAVNVSKRDADLLQDEERIMAERGKDGWARYLIEEIARRDKAAKARRDQLGIYRETEPAVAAAGSNAPPPAVIVEDEE